MNKTNAKTASFLQALSIPERATVKEAESPKPELAPVPEQPRTAPVEPARNSREHKKHLGAYFHEIDDAEVLEQFAVLRARLRLDNSGLMRLMIGETYRKYEAKKAFGDT